MIHYDNLNKELGKPGVTYHVVCAECKQDKYPYRTTPPPDPFVCALCMTKPRSAAFRKLRRRGPSKGKTKGRR